VCGPLEAPDGHRRKRPIAIRQVPSHLPAISDAASAGNRGVPASAARYGVDATPVREALWNLAGEGLIQYEPQAGFRVAVANCDRLTGLSGLRQRVVPWMLGRAMHNPDRSWVAGVETAYARLGPIDALVGDRRAVNPEWQEAHRLFHLSLLAGANMPSLREISRRHEEIKRYRRLTSPTLGDTVGNKSDHDVLFEAIVAGDAARAVATLERHIRDTTARHLRYFDRSGA
jgi:GntR family transcriptional regulator, carbon starvation induced regulator